MCVCENGGDQLTLILIQIFETEKHLRFQCEEVSQITAECIQSGKVHFGGILEIICFNYL